MQAFGIESVCLIFDMYELFIYTVYTQLSAIKQPRSEANVQVARRKTGPAFLRAHGRSRLGVAYAAGAQSRKLLNAAFLPISQLENRFNLSHQYDEKIENAKDLANQIRHSDDYRASIKEYNVEPGNCLSPLAAEWFSGAAGMFLASIPVLFTLLPLLCKLK